MTRQTTAPVEHLSLNPSNRLGEDLYYQHERGAILLDPPYQRGSVWTTTQRLDLMFSWLSGYPIGAVILNDRQHAAWDSTNPGMTVAYAVIDGRQRLETLIAWFDGRLAIPATWLRPEWIDPQAVPADDGDGPYITETDLTVAGQRLVSSRMAVPVVTAQVSTVEAEAEIFRLVNSGGTPQTEQDMSRAAQVESH